MSYLLKIMGYEQLWIKTNQLDFVLLLFDFDIICF